MCNFSVSRNQNNDLKITPKNQQNINATSVTSKISTSNNFAFKTLDKFLTSKPEVSNNQAFTKSLEFKTKGSDIKSIIDYKSNIDEAQNWRAGEVGLTGVQANKIINKTYSQTDKLFTEYINTKEPVANWMTFGKYASTEAGYQIKTVEGTIEALKTLKEGNKTYSDNTKAVKAFSQILSNPDSRIQGLIMGVQIAKNISSNSFVQDLLISSFKDLAKTGDNTLVTGAMSLGIFSLPGINKAIDKAINEMNILHSGLVEGNTLIYKNIVPAFEIYLNAEKSGKDGVKALKENGYGKPVAPNDKKIFVDKDTKDPQGYLLEGFTCYKKAKEAYKKGDKAKGDALIHKGNLLLGCQEQFCILQKPTIYGGKMSSMVDAMSGTMSITDGGGKKNPLLNSKFDANGKQSIEEQFAIIKNIIDNKTPNKKGWSDFETRMGLKEVPKGTPNSVEMRVPSKDNPQGQIKYYAQRDITDPLAQGTISKYFTDNLLGDNARRNIADKPREMNQIYTSTDMKIGNSNFQLDKVVSGPFSSEEDALNKAKEIQKKEKSSWFGNVQDFAVSKVYENNTYKYYVKSIDSLNEDDRDIQGIGELRVLKFIGQAADNIYAIVADNGEVMKNPIYKKDI
ncbi:MAG: hypothetical protein U0354_18795 [Candidatus Sericytochromatia bacterium]